MQNTTDWLMVIITTIYVIATIRIQMANTKTANLAREQIDEMRREFEASNNPRIEVELQYLNHCAIVLRFKNNGKSTAQRVSICLDDSFINGLPEKEFADTLRMQKGKECIIGVGQYYDLFLGTSKLIRSEKEPISGNITYRLGEKEFKDDFYIDINNYSPYFYMEKNGDDLGKALQKMNAEIRDINSTLVRIEKRLNPQTEGDE